MDKRKDIFYNTVLMAPAFIIYTVLMVIPIFQSVYLSFFKWNGIPSSAKKFVGLGNFIELLTNSHFWLSMYNVCIFVLSSVLLIMPLAIILALIVTSKIKAKRFFKTSFFMPVVISLTAVALMWTFILYPDGGLINTIMNKVGLSFMIKDWLGDTSIAIFTIVIINAWQYTGLSMIIFSAAMVSIPEQLYEAAYIDGSGKFTTFWYVTVPLLKNAFEIFFLQALVFSLRHFETVFVMTRGGPAGSTDVPIVLLYKQAFQFSNFGYASSIGTFILGLSIIIAIINNKVFNSGT